MKDKELPPLKRLFRLLSNEKTLVGNIYVYAIFNGLLNLSIPLGIQAIVNLIQSGTTSTSWIVLVGLVLLGLTLAGIFQIFQFSLAETIQQKIFANASIEFAFRLPRLKISSIRSAYPPELVNRFFDVMTIQKGLSKILFDFSLAALQIFFGLLLLAFYHPFFIAFGILLLILLILFFIFTSRSGLSTSLEESKHKYKLVGWLEEVARNLSTFKMAGRSRLPLERADTLSMEYLKSRQSHFSILVRQYAFLIGFKVLISGSLLIIGGILVFNSEMNIGQFVAAEIIILLTINSVEKLILSMETIYDVLTGLEKVGSITDLDLEKSEHHEKVSESSPISIKAKNISLRSPQLEDKMVLQNVSFNIKGGQKVGIAGTMGAGKTSLLSLICGLFDTYDGKLLFNGIPMQHLDLEGLRNSIRDNLGEESIFEDTLLHNINLGREGISTEEVKAAIEICGLQQFTEDLPKGIYTILPSSGLGLALSIKSRILMARCLAGKPCMVLLEDNWKEVRPEIVDRWFHKILEGNHTLLVASNDHEILKHTDEVLVLKDGQLIRSGKFSELKDQLPC